MLNNTVGNNVQLYWWEPYVPIRIAWICAFCFPETSLHMQRQCVNVHCCINSFPTSSPICEKIQWILYQGIILRELCNLMVHSFHSISCMSLYFFLMCKGSHSLLTHSNSGQKKWSNNCYIMFHEWPWALKVLMCNLVVQYHTSGELESIHCSQRKVLLRGNTSLIITVLKIIGLFFIFPILFYPHLLRMLFRWNVITTLKHSTLDK